MSLYGYTKKHKPALWLSVNGALPVKSKDKAERLARSRRIAAENRYKARSKARKRAYDRVKRENKPLKATRKRILPVSKRQAGRMAYYRIRAKVFVEAAQAAGKVCPVWAEVLHQSGWTMQNYINSLPTEVHHTRGRMGPLLLDERFWIAVSADGHNWIHSHPAAARERGWICGHGKWNQVPKES